VGRYEELPVFRDVCALTSRVFEVTQHFPREYKFTLGQDMKRDCLMLLRQIYRINRSEDKVEGLEVFMDDFELLRLEIRLATDLKIMSVRRQADLAAVCVTGRDCHQARVSSTPRRDVGSPSET